MSKQPQMRDIKLGEPVTITLPAYVWVGFVASYTSSPEYNCGHANTVASAAQEAILDPVYLKERIADAERMASQQQSYLSNIIPGFPGPQIPPDLSGFQQGEDQ